jgi:hypothetical protein
MKVDSTEARRHGNINWSHSALNYPGVVPALKSALYEFPTDTGVDSWVTGINHRTYCF